MDQKYQEFYNQTIGKVVETEDPTNYGQCFDEVLAWCDKLGIPRETIRHLYAYQIYTLAGDYTKKYFDIIPNGPTNKPKKGDIVVFGTSVGPAGHTSIETGKSTSQDLITLDQNWGSPKYVKEVIHKNYQGCLGWLSPKTMLTDDQWEQQVRQILGKQETPTQHRAEIKALG